MELSTLKYFYEVAKLEHITKASQNLFISQPALTKTIKNLEKELGVELFYKDGRRIKLTEYGSFLKEKVGRILTELELLSSSIEKLIDLTEQTITVNALAASTIVTDTIIEYKKLYPNVVFKMLQQDNGEDFDVLVTTSAYNENFEPLFQGLTHTSLEEKIFLATPKDSPFNKDDGINLKELAHQDFIALSGAKKFRPMCDTYCRHAGFTPQVVFESDSLLAVKNLIGAGVGLAFWPQFSWGSINDTNIKLVPINDDYFRREIVVGIKKGKRASTLVKNFYEFLVAKFTQEKLKTV